MTINTTNEGKIGGKLFSYHVFLFPFKWYIKGKEKLSFSDRNSIKDFKLSKNTSWENIASPMTDAYKQELYNEKKFFYSFTHPTLYNTQADDSIMHHHERREPYEQNLIYKIHVVADRESLYELKIKSICLNLYNTGVGVLMFYLENDRYKEWDDIHRINQFGRRIAPPYFELKDGIAGTKRLELADSISIEGLKGNPNSYFEDFNDYTTIDDNLVRPAKFISSLISDFSDEMKIFSLIDSRMFVICWYGNDKQAEKISSKYDSFKLEDDWYKFVFVESGNASCKNDALRKEMIERI